MFKNRKLCSSLLVLTLMCGGLVGCGHKPTISKPTIKKEVKKETTEEKVTRIAKEYINLYTNIDYKTYSQEDYNKLFKMYSSKIQKDFEIAHFDYNYYKNGYIKNKTQEKVQKIKDIKIEKITDKVYSFKSVIVVQNSKKETFEGTFDLQIDVSNNKITYFKVRSKQ